MNTTHRSPRLTRLAALAALALAHTLALTACVSIPVASADDESSTPLVGTLIGGGASAQGAAQNAWIADFTSLNSEVTITYDQTGSGGGRNNLISGENHFSGSDRAFHLNELADNTFVGCVPNTPIVEIPAYISPIAIIFNLGGIRTLNLDATTISRIFTGDITQWNDAAIVSQNADVTLPDLAISVVYREDESGTTENLAEYLAANAPDVWTHEVSGDWPYAAGTAVPQTGGVIDAVSATNGTFGYADASRAGSLGTVALKVGSSYVPYSASAAAAVVDASPYANGRDPVDLVIELDRTSQADGVYPIVLISYLMACSEYQDAEVAALVKAYFAYAISDRGQATGAAAAGIAPISAALFEKASAAVESIR